MLKQNYSSIMIHNELPFCNFWRELHQHFQNVQTAHKHPRKRPIVIHDL